MRVKVAFHNVQHSDALENFLKEKSQKLQVFLNNNERINWVINFKGKQFLPQLKLHVKGKSLSIKSKADNAFIAAANVVEKAKRVLRDRHDKSQPRH
jgi:ribosome-associated translation inhibitor RaiA